MKRIPKGTFWFVFYCVLVALAISLAASAQNATNTPAATSEPNELGVIVTNDTDGNIAVFGGGVSGTTVPPGRSCLVPFPRQWAWITVRVVQMNSEGDFFDPESRLYKTGEAGVWRVKRHEF